MNPTFRKRSGALIIHACWRSSEESTRTMFSGVSHVLAMRDGKLLVICCVGFDELKVVCLDILSRDFEKIDGSEGNSSDCQKDRRWKPSLERALGLIQRFLKEKKKVINFFCNREAARHWLKACNQKENVQIELAKLIWTYEIETHCAVHSRTPHGINSPLDPSVFKNESSDNAPPYNSSSSASLPSSLCRFYTHQP